MVLLGKFGGRELRIRCHGCSIQIMLYAICDGEKSCLACLQAFGLSSYTCFGDEWQFSTLMKSRIYHRGGEVVLFLRETLMVKSVVLPAISAQWHVLLTVFPYRQRKTIMEDVIPISSVLTSRAVFSVAFAKKHAPRTPFNSLRILRWLNTIDRTWSMRRKIC